MIRQRPDAGARNCWGRPAETDRPRDRGRIRTDIPLRSKKLPNHSSHPVRKLVRPAGLGPATSGLVIRRSIRLSYGRPFRPALTSGAKLFNGRVQLRALFHHLRNLRRHARQHQARELNSDRGQCAEYVPFL